MRIFFGKKVICFPSFFLAHDLFPYSSKDIYSSGKIVIVKGKRGHLSFSFKPFAFVIKQFWRGLFVHFNSFFYLSRAWFGPLGPHSFSIRYRQQEFKLGLEKCPTSRKQKKGPFWQKKERKSGVCVMDTPGMGWIVSPKSTYWSLNPSTSECNLVGNKVFKDVIQLKLGHQGGALIHYNRCSYKKRKRHQGSVCTEGQPFDD